MFSLSEVPSFDAGKYEAEGAWPTEVLISGWNFKINTVLANSILLELP
jgi:hypothetical protein